MGQAQLLDQAAQLPWYLRQTAPRERLPAPVPSEARPMPSNDGLRLDNRDSVQHRRKQAIEPDKEQSVRHRQLRLRGYALTQHVQLMPQHDDVGFQARLRLERRDHDVKKQAQERDHRGSAYLISHVTPARMEYSVRTGEPAIEPNKQKTIDICQSRPLWHPSTKHVDLLPEDQILCLQFGSRLKQRSQNGKNQPEQFGHQAASLPRSFLASTANRIFATHTQRLTRFQFLGFGRRQSPRWT